MEIVKYHDNSKLALGPIAFLKDVPNHVKIRDIEASKKSALIGVCMAFQAEKSGGLVIADFIKGELVELVSSQFKSLSLSEIYYAFKLDRFGEFGDPTPHYNSFSIQYVVQVLKKYTSWRQKKRYHHNLPISKTIDKTINELSEKEKNELVCSGVLEEFDSYKETRVISTGRVYLFDVLKDVGLIKEDITDKHIDRAIKYLKDEAMMLSNEDKWRSKKGYEKMIAELENRQDTKIIITAKKLLIGDCFSSIEKDPLKDVLTKKLLK